MDRRRLLMILAVFVAVIGTLLVFVYVKGADNRAGAKLDNVNVLKATADIKAGESYDTALANGEIALLPVPSNQQNPGVVTDTTQLKGKTVTVPIFSGQQILSNQFGDASKITSTTALPVPKGMVAISIQLNDPDRVAGNVYAGSHVAIFVTHDGGPEHSARVPTGAGELLDETALMLPNVLVLNVGDPAASTTTTTTTSTTTTPDGVQTTETLPRTLFTLAVDQSEAQRIILTSKIDSASLTFALLTDSSKVHKGPGTTLPQIFK